MASVAGRTLVATARGSNKVATPVLVQLSQVAYPGIFLPLAVANDNTINTESGSSLSTESGSAILLE